MEFVRVFTNPQRCMQRLGFLKHLVWRASLSATNNLSGLGKDLVASAAKKVSVQPTPQLIEYIKTALSGPKYKDLRDFAGKLEGSETRGSAIEVEKQDYYLAQVGVSSRRGKLVTDDWRRFPYLAVALGLLRKGTYSLLVRGQAFLALIPEEEKRAFLIDQALPLLSSTTNPLRLSTQQRIILLFSIVRNDGDILGELYARLFTICRPFADWEAGDYLPDIYKKVARSGRQKVRSGEDLLKIQRLLDTADTIQQWKGKRYKGRGARDEAAIIRLEPFVDLGLLTKPDPFAYRYQTTEATRIFFESLLSSENIEMFLNHSFFAALSKGLGLDSQHYRDQGSILLAIRRAYKVLRSPLGYAPLVEVALLAGIYSLTETGKYFEVAEAIEALKSFQKEAPDLVIFNVDRWGALSVVKFTGDQVDRLKK